MYVYTPVRNNAGRATTLALAHYPFSGQPPPSRPALPRGCHHPYRATPTLTATYTLYHRPPTSPVSSSGHPLPPPSPRHPIALHLNSVSTASLLLPSATHTTTHLLSPITYVVLLSLYVPFSFPFCFHFRLPQTPDPIHPAGKTVRRRKYGNTGAVSQRECDNTKNFD